MSGETGVSVPVVSRSHWNSKPKMASAASALGNLADHGPISPPKIVLVAAIDQKKRGGLSGYAR